MMLKAKYKSVFLFLVVIACQEPYKVPPMESRVYLTDKGYCYTISMDSTIIVRQEHIPSYGIEIAFSDSLTAVRVSQAVMDRIANEESANITKEDLRKLNVE